MALTKYEKNIAWFINQAHTEAQRDAFGSLSDADARVQIKAYAQNRYTHTLPQITFLQAQSTSDEAYLGGDITGGQAA